MKPDTCKEIMLNHLKEHKGEWVKKGAMYCVAEEAGFSPETGARKLRELAEDGTIQMDMYKGQRGQKLARYAYDKPIERKLIIKVVDGKAIQTYV